MSTALVVDVVVGARLLRSIALLIIDRYDRGGIVVGEDTGRRSLIVVNAADTQLSSFVPVLRSSDGMARPGAVQLGGRIVMRLGRVRRGRKCQ